MIIATAEVAFFFSIVLLGKPFQMLKTRLIKSLKGTIWTLKPISKRRHNVGIAMILLSFLPYYITQFVLILFDLDQTDRHILVGLLMLSDVLFMTSLFVLGGEFWERLNKLFKWPGDEVTKENKQ
ncbi:MAG: hypothetical protein KKC80_08795 [Candidatus Margulisbacteria bacterium]|nr:hypothetical protein [Candidatus Margulisiibacteriota bacterium]